MPDVIGRNVCIFQSSLRAGREPASVWGRIIVFDGGKDREGSFDMNENNGTNWRLIARTINAIRDVEEKFRKIQENPALHGAELGLTAEEHEMLEKVIEYCGEVAIAGDAIARRHIGDIESASRFFQATKSDPNDPAAE
jgi:hypothetical protein